LLRQNPYIGAVEWIFVVAAVFVAQLVRGVTGFGSALVAVPLLAWVWGPQQAVTVTVLIDMIGGFVLLPSARSKVNVALVLAMFLPALLGQFVGTELLVSLPEVWVRRLLGLLVIVFGLDMVARPVKEGRGEWEAIPEGRRDLFGWGAAAGLLGGTMAGLVGAGGPPIVVFLRRFFVDAFARAQMIGLFFLTSISLSSMLAARGVTDSSSVTRAALLLLPMALGAVVGTRLSTRVPRFFFGRFVGLLLAGTGIGLMIS
jgi:uncharacterized membrane protein YfcA